MLDKVEVGVSLPLKIENAEREVGKLQGYLSKLDLGKTLSKDFANLFGNLQKEFDKAKSLTANNKLKIADDKAVGKSVDRIISLYETLQKKMASEGISTVFLKKDAIALKGLKEAQDIYTKAIKDSVKEEEKLNNELERAKQKKIEIEKSHSKKPPISDAAYFDLQAKEKALKSQHQNAISNSGKLRNAVEAEIQKSGKPVTFDKLPPNSIIRRTEAYKKYKETQQEAIRLEKEHKEVIKALDTTMSESQARQQMEQATAAIAEAQQKLNAFKSEGGKGFKDQADGLKAMKDHLLSIQGVDWSKMGIDIKTIKSGKELEQILKTLEQRAIASGNAVRKNLTDPMKNLGQTVQETGKEYTQASLAVQQAQEKATTAENFSNRIKYFLSLNGAIMLLRRTLRNAMQTVKELDAQMTEMAVVTDLGIGDYWEQLPEYTARANELGVSIKGAYEAATLYYQQGLKTNEVIEISNETLKMARIAGLGAEDATNKMTAALRGFNMELNETSAQKVNDVYSKLAAITASDTKEISTAMTKTASIAHNAGMEFETTAAFLSQIIETTRESAETAGTAMKTIIARFQELKKSPDKIIDVDGEKVDANKIEGALRSVGVALRDDQGQFRQLDKVFMELASKWDTLDTNTQRYIATIAAGSRQQSRFIAMMSDYGRTSELIDAANNSAGASQEQFNKTLDSLQTKLQNLKNAWNSFSMGIMNSDLIKFGVDFLTKIITALDNVSKSFNGITGSITKIGMTYALFKSGKALFDKFSIKIISHFKTLGQQAGAGFGQGFSAGANGQAVPTNGESRWAQFKGNIGALRKNGAYNDVTQTAHYDDYIATKNNNIVASNAFYAADSQFKQADQDYIKAKKEIEGSHVHNKQGKGSKKAQKAFANAESKRNAALQTRNSAEQNAIAANEAAMKAQAVQEQEILEQRRAQWDKFGQGIAQVGQTMMLTGVAFGMFGTILEDLGLEGASETFGKIGSVLTMVGMAASVLAPIFSMLGKAFLSAGAQGAAAGTAVSAAWLPVTVIIVAVVAAIFLVVAAFTAIKNNSPEGVMNRLAKEEKSATEQAQNLAEAYENLNKSLDSLDEKQEKIKSLTKGTEEWKKAVQESNDAVLKLAEENPNLEITNKDGILSIDRNSEHNKAVLAEQEKNVTRSKSVAISAKQARSEATLNYKRSVLSDKATYGSETGSRLSGSGIGAALAGMLGLGVVGMIAGGILGSNKGAEAYKTAHGKETDGIAAGLAKGIIEVRDGELQKKENVGEEELEKLGISSDVLKNAGKDMVDAAADLKEYGKYVLQQRQEQEVLNMQKVENILNSKTDMSESTKNAVRNWADSDYMSKIEEEERQKVANVKWKENSGDVLAMKNAIGEAMYGDKFIGVKGNKFTYEDENGKKQTAKISNDILSKKWAAIASEERASNYFGQLSTAIEHLGDSQGNHYRKLLTDKDGKNLTQADLAKFEDEDLERAYNKLSEADKEAFGELDEFKRKIKETTDVAKNGFDKVSKQFKKIGLTNTDPFKNLTYGAAQGLADNITQLVNTSGTNGVDNLLSDLNSEMERMGPEMANKFSTILGDIDWSSLNEWDAAEKQLADSGIVVNQEIEGLISSMKELSKATRTLTKEQIDFAYTQIGGIQKNLQEGKQSRTFSKEQYEAIMLSDTSGLLKKQFMQTLDGSFVYLGNHMEELGEKLAQNTEQLARSNAKNVENARAIGGFAAEEAENSFLSSEQKKQYNKYKREQKDLIEKAQHLGTDIYGLGTVDYNRFNELGGLITNIENSKLTTEDRSNWVEADYQQYLKQYQHRGFDFSSIGITDFTDNVNLKKTDLATLIKWTNAITEAGGKFTTGAYDVEEQSIINDQYRKGLQIQSLSSNMDAFNNELDVEKKKIIGEVLNTQIQGYGASEETITAFNEALAKGDMEAIKEILKPILSIEEATREQIKLGRKNYQDLENRIKTALIKEKQDKIDADSKLFDLLNEMNDDILSNMQEQLEEQRQARENDKTENELNDLYNQLSYLEMDSSGRNAGEILELQKQIAEKEQGYQDSLIDQEVSDMQKANEEAAAQREQQIQIAQDTLKAWEESGAIWTLVDQKINEMKTEMVTKGINAADTIVGQWLGAAEGTNLMSAIGKADWALALNQLAEAVRDWKPETEEDKRTEGMKKESEEAYAQQQFYEELKKKELYELLEQFKTETDVNKSKLIANVIRQEVKKEGLDLINKDLVKELEIYMRSGKINGSTANKELLGSMASNIQITYNIQPREDQDPEEFMQAVDKRTEGIISGQRRNISPQMSLY